MVCRTRTNILVIRVLHQWVAARVSDRSLQNALILGWGIMFEEDVLDAPKAPCGEGGDFCVGS